MVVLRSIVYFEFLFMFLSGVLSKLQPFSPTSNLTASSRRTYQPVAVDWRSKALDKYSESDKSTLNRRECWIMKMGPEDDWQQDVVKCTDKKAPTLRQLIAHGRNGAEFAKADRLHTPVFYTDWKGTLGAGALARLNPSEKILWYINRSFTGYRQCEGALIAQYNEMNDYPEDYPEYVNKEYGTDQLMTLTWCYCQSLALAAMPDSGEAWIAMPWSTDDYKWLPNSNWNINELPALTRNYKIQKIIRFDPKLYFYNPEKVWPSEKESVVKAQPRTLATPLVLTGLSSGAALDRTELKRATNFTAGRWVNHGRDPKNDLTDLSTQIARS